MCLTHLKQGLEQSQALQQGIFLRAVLLRVNREIFFSKFP